MIKKCRVCLALGLVLAGSSSEGIEDKVKRSGKCRVHRRAYKWIRGEMKTSPV
jgi:hypothetical protein